jgi:hypothetical protein|tara:strand:+ start:781 stop:990 length:210 start_codon:yes stop_codon:yes gene_type:complete
MSDEIDKENETKEYKVCLSGHVDAEVYIQAQSADDAKSKAEYLSVSDIVHNGDEIDFISVAQIDEVTEE